MNDEVWEAELAPEPWFENHIWTKGGRLNGRHVATVHRKEDCLLIVEMHNKLKCQVDT